MVGSDRIHSHKHACWIHACPDVLLSPGVGVGNDRFHVVKEIALQTVGNKAASGYAKPPPNNRSSPQVHPAGAVGLDRLRGLISMINTCGCH